MALSRKQKNRQIERKHVLEVKLRSRQARRARMRWASTAVAACLGTATVLLILWQGGAWVLDQFVFHNPAFGVQHMNIYTDGVIPLDQIGRWSGVNVGDNLLALDLARVKRDLELAPWVKSAALERVVPHTLNIRIAEREPLAQVMTWQLLPSGTGCLEVVYYLDSSGCVMRLPENLPTALRTSRTNEVLPMFVGVAARELRPGRRVKSGQVRAALELVSAFQKSPMLGLTEILEVDVSSPDILRVTTGTGSDIIFTPQGPAHQLERWRLIADHGYRTGKTILSLDLSVSNNLPVMWIDASLGSLADRKPDRPAPNRKKDV